ncbi:uncharacterized protein LOC117103114 [Anneissia japonica]|uniref:uncharacterized protein LOC117103114 n=1 Tax=Anneissia japonica TaxID=1529436 RepID=UPI001425A4DC|nr:uncharacterized protein LOC117103114 [Anneissia japonica]
MIFGKHSMCRSESNSINLTHIKQQPDFDFLDIESIGVRCSPRCGGCKCGNCPLGAKRYTLREERELNLIDDGLTYEDGRWPARYPWIKDPHQLPDNRPVAEVKLKALEKKLFKDPTGAICYTSQIDDMVKREVARKVNEDEMRRYKGPVHYIAHHGVPKPDSKSTPFRIVFNSSASYHGHILNEYWGKGPDLNNNILAVLLRFRRDNVALVGDTKKIYHSVGISELDQHTHRFLWRNMDVNQPIRTYCVTAVNFGDGPSATIAIRALQKTAELYKDEFPEAAMTLENNVYMDDIVDNVPDVNKAYERAKEIDTVLAKGKFMMKEWIVSGVENEPTKFLGLKWNPRDDQLKVPIPTQLTDEFEKLTKRKCLSATNAIYDPLGLLSPVTVKAKILLRRLWGKKLEWDDQLDVKDCADWFDFSRDVKACEDINIKRSVKPPGILAVRPHSCNVFRCLR